MLPFDKTTMSRQAKELGFVRDTFEKVFRLTNILSFFEKDNFLSQCLALKGGTAINLTIFNLPRLSIDIDLDYVGSIAQDTMQKDRVIISERIAKFMTASGYSLSAKSKSYHALDSFVYEYTNCGETKDNIKIEINYMLRSHVLPLVRNKVILSWFREDLNILSVHPIEIFASKIVALCNRAAVRDLYDLYNLQKYDIFTEAEKTMLRKCFMFYSAIASDSVPEKISFASINSLTQNRIKSDLVPVIHSGTFFNLKESEQIVVNYLNKILNPTDKELSFWATFKNKEYKPELLFDDIEIIDRIILHPMALWKCR